MNNKLKPAFLSVTGGLAGEESKPLWIYKQIPNVLWTFERFKDKYFSPQNLKTNKENTLRIFRLYIKTPGSESRGQVKQLRTPQQQMTRPLHVRILQERTL